MPTSAVDHLHFSRGDPRLQKMQEVGRAQMITQWTHTSVILPCCGQLPYLFHHGTLGVSA
jgi:hypothetical protein